MTLQLWHQKLNAPIMVKIFLPPQYGLYSAFMGCFVYMFLGSCKDITIGPTAIMSIMTHQYSVSGNADYAILLCFLSGLIIFASGLCNMGMVHGFHYIYFSLL